MLEHADGLRAVFEGAVPGLDFHLAAHATSKDAQASRSTARQALQPAGADRSRSRRDPRRACRQRYPVCRPAKNRSRPAAPWRGHPFDRTCRQHCIEHRLTKPNLPWTNGQVERMKRIPEEATVQRCCETHDQLRGYLADFVMACNFARRLKTLMDLTPANTSAKPDPKRPIASLSIQPIKCRDQTPSRPSVAPSRRPAACSSATRRPWCRRERRCVPGWRRGPGG